MIELEYFLHPDLCSYLIKFYEKNQEEKHFFNGRYIIDLKKTTDPFIEDTIKSKYQKLYPTYNLSTLQLVKWNIGAEHGWHDDTRYYHKSTITYLNEGYEGGRTQIENYVVEPKIGKIIFFDSDKKHKVSTLMNNTRYVIAAWFNLPS